MCLGLAYRDMVPYHDVISSSEQFLYISLFFLAEDHVSLDGFKQLCCSDCLIVVMGDTVSDSSTPNCLVHGK